MIFPTPLSPGDTIGIMAPATEIRHEYVHGAVSRLQSAGMRVCLMPHTIGHECGTYASALETRLSDFVDLWGDTDVRAILCARGGYGTIQLLPDISDALLLSDPKWLIGFSDISALHARLQAVGIASLHANMCKHLALEEVGQINLDRLLDVICAVHPSLAYPAATINELTATGTLIGGNLAVLNHLIATPWDMLSMTKERDTILFIEDVSEAVYATERMLFQLKFAGILDACHGVVVGQFTKARGDKNFDDTLTMIRTRFAQWGLTKKMPIAYDFPTGHIADNMPLIEGATATLAPGRLILTT